MVNGGWVIAVYRLTEDKNKKTLIVPVWTDSAYLKPIAKAKNPFIIHHALQGKFIVIYSGNLAYTHNVEALAEKLAIYCS